MALTVILSIVSIIAWSDDSCVDYMGHHHRHYHHHHHYHDSIMAIIIIIVFVIVIITMRWQSCGIPGPPGQSSSPSSSSLSWLWWWWFRWQSCGLPGPAGQRRQSQKIQRRSDRQERDCFPFLWLTWDCFAFVFNSRLFSAFWIWSILANSGFDWQSFLFF